MFAVQFFPRMSLPQNVINCYHGITISYLPSPRYYCEIFPISAVITVVTAVLPWLPRYYRFSYYCVLLYSSPCFGVHRTVSVEKCTNSTIVLGPVELSVDIVRCTGTTVIAVGRRFTTL